MNPVMSAEEHYAAAMHLAASHDRISAEVQAKVGRPLSTEQSLESATWVIAHALLGLLADRLEGPVADG